MKGIYLDVAFKNETDADSFVEVVTATVGQEFPPIKSSCFGRTHQPPEQDPWLGS
jgi:hypothetical protein